MPNAIYLHRVIRSTPEKLYRAFLEPAALTKWLPPNGFTCNIQEMNAVVGGGFRMSFANFGTGASHSFGGEYLELIPNQLIRYTDRFDDPNLPGVIEVRVQISPVACGVELRLEQAGIPDAIPPEMCYLGWQESLNLLVALVEVDIP